MGWRCTCCLLGRNCAPSGVLRPPGGCSVTRWRQALIDWFGQYRSNIWHDPASTEVHRFVTSEILSRSTKLGTLVLLCTFAHLTSLTDPLDVSCGLLECFDWRYTVGVQGHQLYVWPLYKNQSGMGYSCDYDEILGRSDVNWELLFDLLDQVHLGQKVYIFKYWIFDISRFGPFFTHLETHFKVFPSGQVAIS